MVRIVKINEQQYRRLMLDEEMHYPKFLDVLKNEISTKVHIIFSRKLHPSGWRGIESSLYY